MRQRLQLVHGDTTTMAITILRIVRTACHSFACESIIHGWTFTRSVTFTCTNTRTWHFCTVRAAIRAYALAIPLESLGTRNVCTGRSFKAGITFAQLGDIAKSVAIAILMTYLGQKGYQK